MKAAITSTGTTLNTALLQPRKLRLKLPKSHQILQINRFCRHELELLRHDRHRTTISRFKLLHSDIARNSSGSDRFFGPEQSVVIAYESKGFGGRAGVGDGEIAGLAMRLWFGSVEWES